MTSILNVAEGPWGRSAIYKEKIRTGKRIMSEELVKSTLPTKTTRDTVVVPPKRASIHAIEDSEVVENAESHGIEPQKSMFTKLPYYLCSMIGTILEDAATQLRILVEGSNEIKVIKTKSDWAFLQRQKFGVEEPICVDELEGINVKNLGCNEYKIEKLDADRIYVIEAVKTLYVDISLKKSFKPLHDIVQSMLVLQDYRIALAVEEANNRIIRRDLARQLRQLRNHIKSSIYDTDVKIDMLISEIEDIGLVSECRSRFIVNWQRARTEQHEDIIQDTETDFNQSIRLFKERTDQEHRVHMEVETIMAILINETLEKVEDIMTKYDVDMEAIDLKIQIKKNDYQNAMNKRIEIQKTIDKHGKEMSDWVYFKDEREKARVYREKMTNAAVVVQAWWRGLLVRQQLGPFKPQKGRGAAGKKKK